MGKIKIKFFNRNQWVLKEVRHILDLKRNLILASKLDGEGYMDAFSNKTWKVSKGSIVVARGYMVDTLYFLTSTSNDAMDLAPTSENVVIEHHKFE